MEKAPLEGNGGGGGGGSSSSSSSSSSSNSSKSLQHILLNLHYWNVRIHCRIRKSPSNVPSQSKSSNNLRKYIILH